MTSLQHPAKWLLVCLCAVLAEALPTIAQTENRSISLTVGGIRDVSVPFAIRECIPGNRELIKVTWSSPSQTLSVTGIKEGSTDLKIVGDGEATAIYRVVVLSSLDSLLAEVRKDTEDIPGVEAEISNGKVVLRGKVTKPRHWERMTKRLLPSYGDRVQNKVEFTLGDDLLLSLKSDLEKAHFKVLERSELSSQPGQLSLYCSERKVVVGGTVYSRGELDSINSILAACPWLRLKRDQDKDPEDSIYAVNNVTITPVTLEVDVTFLGVTESEATTLGANLLRNGLMAVDAAASVAGSAISGATAKAGHYVVSASMNDTVKAITGGQGVGPTRYISAAHLSFKNDAADWKRFHDGGTIVLPISGGVGGGVGTQPVDYGLILMAKGGLADAQNASLDLQVELSVPVPRGFSPAGPIYDMQKKRVESTAYCPVGKTLILAGSSQLTQGVSLNSATPVLKDIPLLGWLFKEKEKTGSKRQLLILISPQMAPSPIAAPPVVEQTIGTKEKAQQPLSIKDEKIK